MSRIELAPGAHPIASPQRNWAEWIAWVATEDHCAWANRYVAWLQTPLGVLLIGATCSLLCGLFVAPQGYVLLAAITAVVAVGLAWPLVAISGVRCRFEFDTRRGREGQATTSKLIITNRWPWPIWGLAVNDPLLAGEGEAGLALARVEGWSTATFNCSLTPAQRGVYPNGEVRLGTGFPFGLYEASRAAEVPQRLIVWPQTFCLPPLGTTTGRSHWRGNVNEGRTGNEGTRLGVRDHRVGDSLRDVHWAKTARYDRLIVSERESTTVEEAVVIVTTDPHGSEDDPTLEWRLRIAASICESFAANQGRVDLWLGGTKLGVSGNPGDLERLLDQVASFRPGAASGLSIDKNALGDPITVDVIDTQIVLRRSGFGATARHTKSNSPQRPSWIEVDSLVDVPGQVQRGWRLGCGRVSDRRRVSRAG